MVNSSQLFINIWLSGNFCYLTTNYMSKLTRLACICCFFDKLLLLTKLYQRTSRAQPCNSVQHNTINIKTKENCFVILRRLKYIENKDNKTLYNIASIYKYILSLSSYINHGIREPLRSKSLNRLLMRLGSSNNCTNFKRIFTILLL